MSTVKLIVKTTITIILIVMYKIMHSMLPIIQNSIAMTQMDNTIESSMGMQMYNLMYNIFKYSWIVLAIFILALFSNEIIKIIYKIKEKIDEKY